MNKRSGDNKVEFPEHFKKEGSPEPIQYFIEAFADDKSVSVSMLNENFIKDFPLPENVEKRLRQVFNIWKSNKS